MSDMFDKINENAERVAAAHREEQLRRHQAKHQKANKQILIRIAIAVVLTVALYLAAKLGLVVRGLSITLIPAVFVWLAFWVGAWVQFAWCRGGLMK